MQGYFSLGNLSDETYLSTFRSPQEAHSRFSCSHANARGSGRNQGAPRQGACPLGRLSDRKRYPRSQRLRTADIAALLAGSRPLRRPGLAVQVRMNALGDPRLAVMVPKRIFPRAVDRNRMKRLVREWFRCTQAQLGNRDILVRLTAKTVVIADISELLAELS